MSLTQVSGTRLKMTQTVELQGIKPHVLGSKLDSLCEILRPNLASVM